MQVSRLFLNRLFPGDAVDALFASEPVVDVDLRNDVDVMSSTLRVTELTQLRIVFNKILPNYRERNSR